MLSSDEASSAESGVVYDYDDRPPIGRSVIYAFQHIFAMILGSITGGIIIGHVVGLNEIQTGQMIGYINIAVGIATILQVKWGVRLPIVQGSTMGHVPAYIALGTAGVAVYQDPMTTMQYLGGALLVGALLEAAFGGLNLMRYVFRRVSPITVGIVIMMIGLGLWSVVADFIGDAWLYAGAIIVLVIILSFAFGVLMRTMAIFTAVVIFYALATSGTYLGWFPNGHAMNVNFQPIVQSPWVIVPTLFPWGYPKFEIGFILAMAIPYVATALESAGDYIAVHNSVKQEDPSVRRISRGVMMEGIGSSISAMLGGTATSSFSQNVGIVRLTGVASLFVCVLAGFLLIALGASGKLGTILASIPRVILGAVYLMAFGILVMTGLRVIMKADVKSSRNEAIIGSALLLGLALPYYMRTNPLELELPTLQIMANVLLSTPMMVAGIWTFVLDNTIPGTDEERGLNQWIGQDRQATQGAMPAGQAPKI